MWQKRRPALKPVCRFLMVLVCLAMLIPHRICLCCPCIAHQSNQPSTYTDCPPGSDSLEGDDSCPCHGHTRQASIVLPAKQFDQSCPTHDNHAPGCPTKNPTPTIIQPDDPAPPFNNTCSMLCRQGFLAASNSICKPLHSTRTLPWHDHRNVIQSYCKLTI